MTALAALLGAGVGTGLLLIAAGLRPAEPPPVGRCDARSAPMPANGSCGPASPPW
ncbi:MAG: hypothetical protein R2755_26365 [Acidimicrobiales bacterium]